MTGHKIITIGREFGSGGHEIGQKLADKLGIQSFIVRNYASFARKYSMDRLRQAVEDFRNKADSQLLDDIVNMNIMMTGLISNLSVGGKSLALAHNYYDAICCLHHEIRKNFLHGELVGMALPMQIYVNGGTEEEIRTLQSFLKDMEVPVTLEDVGFPRDEKALEELVEYIYRVTHYEDEGLKKKIREGMEYLKATNW